MDNPATPERASEEARAIPPGAAEVVRVEPTIDRAVQAEIVSLFEQGHRGANWFFWVAALSVVNSLLMNLGAGIYFVIGLGATLVADAICLGIGEQRPHLVPLLKGVAIGFAMVVALAVSGIGLFARKRYLLPYVLGMALYLGDGLILGLLQDWLSVAFHAYALYCMWGGLAAWFRLRRLEQGLSTALE